MNQKKIKKTMLKFQKYDATKKKNSSSFPVQAQPFSNGL